MKKFLSILLAMMMILSVVALSACGNDGAADDTTASETNADENNNEPKALKFGMGIYADYETPVDADGENNGTGEAVATVAAVLVDADGKIVKATLDVADVVVEWTAEGAAVPAGEFKTKRELGDDYGMVNYGASDKEWYTQADNFCSFIVGKTPDEIKALIVEGDKGNDDVVNAGCTIMIADFAYAIEKAVKNAADSEATEDAELAIGVVSEVSATDADGENAGVAEIEITATAVAKKDGKVIVSETDCAAAAVGYTAEGACTGTTAGIQTKNEKGDDYGMVAHAGSEKEWYQQADAFDAACKGKTAEEIEALAAASGYGVDDLQSAGCTINIAAMVKAAVKAAK